jgi:exodeoxyribonuclease V alpha subunit
MTGAFRELARPFLEAGVLRPADVHAVALTAPRFGEDDPTRMLGLAFAVRAPREGHAGVDLGTIASVVDDERDAEPDTPATELPWPDRRRWHVQTLESPLVGAPDEPVRPFVAQPLGKRSLLLTRRMFREQERVAAALRERAERTVPGHAQVTFLDARIAMLFPEDPGGEAARAVLRAAERCLAIIVGGPGTGKTFSITRLLAALLAESRGDRPLVIALAAPTGKAAVRMREAIREATDETARPRLDVDDRVRVALRDLEASTLHRLLGVRPDGSSRHHQGNPLPADVVVVDEISMVDLTQMRRLLEAVRPEARLVLLGDRDQLASVEAGCVLADVVGTGSPVKPLAGSVQRFTRSHRFASAPDIALVAACLQSYATAMEGVPEGEQTRRDCAVDVLAGRRHAPNETIPDERVTHLGEPEVDDRGRARPTDAQLRRLAQPYLDGYVAMLEPHRSTSGRFDDRAQDPAFQRDVLSALERYRVLAVHRRGPLGVSGLERALEPVIRARLDLSHDGRWHWIGRPVLVTENAYDLGLMNGDVGLVLPTPDGPAVVFPHERPGQVRKVALSRLPPHQGALAMTVHKSQGSQFDRVALVLAGRRSSIETRELVYTGVTRARQWLSWLGREDELRQALEHGVQRASGLGALLR